MLLSPLSLIVITLIALVIIPQIVKLIDKTFNKNISCEILHLHIPDKDAFASEGSTLISKCICCKKNIKWIKPGWRINEIL